MPDKKNMDCRRVLNLEVGEWIEVRGREEILATLDRDGCLGKMPFMPEMFQYCGKRFRVYKRADKTCQYIVGWSIRRVKDSVHLNLRCDGSGHDGCEAGCLIFWKEAWLKRVEEADVPLLNVKLPPVLNRGGCSMENVLSATKSTAPDGETVYSCQATRVYEFSSYMKFSDPRQYVRDLRSGNLRPELTGDLRSHRVLEMLLAFMRMVTALIIAIFNDVQSRRHGVPYPFIAGKLEKTPIDCLNLRPGELVQVKSKEEIMATLDTQNRNRGLLFDSEMLTYCGGIYRVLRRVSAMIDEKTGKMLRMVNPCIILEGVVCRSDYHRLCPRAIHHYWRENWLERAASVPASSLPEHMATTCDGR